MEKVSFKNSKGKKIVGILHKPKEKADKIVITCHGFTSNKDRERLIMAGNAYAENGIAALRFDFGGSGESYDTEIDIQKQVDDLKSAIIFVKSKGYKNIGVQGESLGGLVSLLAYSKDIKTMVLWAPVSKSKAPTITKDEGLMRELKEKGYMVYEKNGRNFTIPNKYLLERKSVNQEKLLLRIKCPVLILHGDTDDTVPLEHSRGAVEILENSKLKVIKGGSHSLNGKMDEVIPLSVNWFKKYL